MELMTTARLRQVCPQAYACAHACFSAYNCRITPYDLEYAFIEYSFM